MPLHDKWLAWDKGQKDFSLADFELAWTNQDGASRRFSCSRAQALQDGKEHPTQKPLALLKWTVQLMAPDAQLILDPFMGSGTTLVAAKSLERKAIGIEIEEKYCEIAATRLEHEVFDFGEPEPSSQPEQMTLF